MYLRLILLFVLVAALAGAAYWFSNVSFVEDHQKPTIEVVQPPKGLGLQPRVLKFKVMDTGAGLDRVTVALKQRGYSKELFRRALKGGQTFEHEMEIKAEQGYLVEGAADLEIKALDRSFAGNPILQNIKVEVDFKAPKLRPISSQHNLQMGGVQLAFYQVQERALAASGVQVGDLRFLGFPARYLDSSIEAKDLFAAIYTVPSGITDKPYMFAEDLAGNDVTASFYNLALRRRFGSLTVSVKAENLVGTLGSDFADLSEAEQQLRKIRQEANLLIAKLESSAPKEKIWRGAFSKPSGSVRTAFGATMNLVTDRTKPTIKFVETGYAFSDPGPDLSVLAPNSGVIVFAGRLPFYGNSLILAHGFGLTSLLGNVEDIQVQVGERVHTGQLLASRSPAGLFGKGTIFFEMRLQGVPIEPREWWDANWLNQHFDDKIIEAKGAYGQ
jgi:murein DD-endopeptidase MepM/ murein hydrolase activator NlpD